MSTTGSRTSAWLRRAGTWLRSADRSTELLVISAVGIAATALIAVLNRVMDDETIKPIANAFNIFGAALTFFGLFYAYRKAISGRNDVVATTGSAVIYMDSSASARLEFNLNDDEGHTDQLVRIANRLSEMITNAEVRIGDTRRALDRARREMAEADERVRADIDAKIQAAQLEQRQSEVLDLRWAITGVALSTVGALLSFCT